MVGVDVKTPEKGETGGTDNRQKGRWSKVTSVAEAVRTHAHRNDANLSEKMKKRLTVEGAWRRGRRRALADRTREARRRQCWWPESENRRRQPPEKNKTLPEENVVAGKTSPVAGEITVTVLGF
ncbi:hypothetical protein SESBI_32652 [Sesbania bispinosa]|nr:hypothetical protein SESBI_32652 [Sesbania bispinosa]